MAEDMITKYSALELSSNVDEEAVVDLSDLSEDDASKEKISLTLVGRVVSNKSYNFPAFKRTIMQAWGVAERAQMYQLGNGLFVVHLVRDYDKKWVLEGRPWSFDNQLVLVEEVAGSDQPSDLTLTHSPFWVHVCDLPFNCRGKEEVRLVASRMGRVMLVDKVEFGWDKCCRARVEVDVMKPLMRRQKIIDKQGQEKWVGFRYERLPRFCFSCGIIGHVQRDCTVAGDAEESDGGTLWGAWLKVTPKRVTNLGSQGEAGSLANTQKSGSGSGSGSSGAASKNCVKDRGDSFVEHIGPGWTVGCGEAGGRGGVW